MRKWLSLVLLLGSCTKKAPRHYAVLDNVTVRQQLTAYMQHNPLETTALYYLKVMEQGDSTEIVMSSVSDQQTVQFMAPCDLVQMGSHPVLLVASACAQDKPLDLPALAKRHGLPLSQDRTTRRIGANGHMVTLHETTLYCPPMLTLKLYHNQVVRVI